MTKEYMLYVGSMRPLFTSGKHERAVINRCLIEPDTIAIVKTDQSTVRHLYRVDSTGRSKYIGWIQEAEE